MVVVAEEVVMAADAALALCQFHQTIHRVVAAEEVAVDGVMVEDGQTHITKEGLAKLVIKYTVEQVVVMVEMHKMDSTGVTGALLELMDGLPVVSTMVLYKAIKSIKVYKLFNINGH